MLWLKVCIALLILAQFGCGQDRQQCKSVGQYCQLSSQCCQNLYCLSYAYKCVRSFNDDLADEIQSTVFNSIHQLVNRFGDEKRQTIPSVQPTTPTITTTPSTTLQILTNEAIPMSSGSNGIAGINCLPNGNLCSSAKRCCSGHCSKILNKCASEAVNDTESTEPTTPKKSSASTNYDRTPSCVPAGGHCYFPRDCCQPLYCHGYAHKCVT